MLSCLVILFLSNCDFSHKPPKTEPATQDGEAAPRQGEAVTRQDEATQENQPATREGNSDPEVKTSANETIPLKREVVEKNVRTAPLGEVFETGIASWYGPDFHGKRTANGEVYDMYKLTAAHKTLPFHSLVEVENQDNGKRVIVRINDRGPFVKGRIIDLSYTAARKVGSAANGVAPVTLRIAKAGNVSPGELANTGGPRFQKETITETEARDEPEPALVQEAPIAVNYYLQAGAFGEEANAMRMLRNIKLILPEVPFSIRHIDGLHKVVSGPLQTRERAEKLKNSLLDIDIEAFIKEI